MSSQRHIIGSVPTDMSNLSLFLIIAAGVPVTTALIRENDEQQQGSPPTTWDNRLGVCCLCVTPRPSFRCDHSIGTAQYQLCRRGAGIGDAYADDGSHWNITVLRRHGRCQPLPVVGVSRPRGGNVWSSSHPIILSCEGGYSKSSGDERYHCWRQWWCTTRMKRR
jgi:hypothetical protein